MFFIFYFLLIKSLKERCYYFDKISIRCSIKKILKMSKIPRPVKEKNITPDPSPRYLLRWKELFNAIDPEYLKAYIEGDDGFPKSRYEFQMDQSRLEDACDLNVQLFVKVCGQYTKEYGSELYCCLRNQSFAIGWVSEFDENLDTVSPVLTWEEMYLRLVNDTIEYRKRIPDPSNLKAP